MGVKNKNTPTSKRRCRPLRVEDDDTLWFITSRTIEERFWLHPLLTSAFKPANRQARRLCENLERGIDKRLIKLVNRANSLRGPLQPKLTLKDAKRIVRGTVGSAVARAQEKYGTKIIALIAMSNHLITTGTVLQNCIDRCAPSGERRGRSCKMMLEN
jgi:hypothetical protein